MSLKHTGPHAGNDTLIGRHSPLGRAVHSAISNQSAAQKTLVGLLVGSTALAASAQEERVVEEVQVTGIRASLQRAVDQKRNASGVVDAISATDIGAFPDTNLAESLQRITGVSIDRVRGEGSKVTVRGFGPTFNLVTLNGRQMPGANGDDRSFDFLDLASENVAGVQVYKSGNADVPSGGIGSTINIQTTRPLEAPGFKSVVQARGVVDTSTETGDNVTPELSGLYSNTFADDKIGIAISGSYQDRDNGVNTATVGDYNNFLGIVNNDWGGAGQQQWGGIPNNADQTNRPGDTDIYAVPQSIGYELAEFNRERLNGQLTLQYDASENLRATVDYTYSEVQLERTFNNYSGWFNFGAQVTEFDDGPVASPIIYQENGAATDFAMAAGRDGIRTRNNSIGLNLDYQATDRLNLKFDVHNSTARLGALGDNGTASQVAIASFTRDVTRGIFDGDIPILELELANPLSAQDMIATGSVFDNATNEMNIKQASLDGAFDVDEDNSIDFGFQFTNINNRSQFRNIQRDTWGGTTQPGDIADLLTPADAGNAFDQISNGDDPRRQTQFFTFDIDAMVARIEELGASQSTLGPCGTGLCPSSDYNTDRLTKEDTEAFYLQWNHDRMLGNVPMNLKFGLRYESTFVDSRALVPSYSSIEISCVDDTGQPVLEGCNEFSAVIDSSTFTRLTGEYDHVLPNLDLRFDLTENIVTRVSYSETITRPGFVSIQGGQTINQLLRRSGGNGNQGNPALLPYESQNIDLSAEYYFGDVDYVSVGYFTKDVANFIGIQTLQDQVLFPDLIHPATGEAATFDVNTPVNERDAKVDGFEFAVQKTFANGLGFIVNATIVDADVAYQNDSLGTQFALDGLSDSANLVGFYENDSLQLRVAYNWRDDFFNGEAGASSGTPGPVNVEAYGQWDLSARYNLNDNATIFLEGINVTDETFRAFGREARQTVNAGQTGARYNLGVLYTF